MVGSLFGGSDRNSSYDAELSLMEMEEDNSDPEDDDDNDDDDDDNEDGDLDSIASSVPTTVPSVVDERTAASLLAHKNQERIFYSKLTVIICFLVVAVFVTVAIHGFANAESNSSLETTFDLHVDELLKVATLNYANFMSKSHNFALTITGLTTAVKDTWPLTKWPMVSIADFEIHANFYLQDVRPITSSVQMAQIVTSEIQRKSWEDYSSRGLSQAWISRGYTYLGLNPNDAPDITPYIFRRFPSNGTIYKDEGPLQYYVDDEDQDGEEGGGGNGGKATAETNIVYTPLWMGSPTNVVVEHVNYNARDDPTVEGVYNFLVESSSSSSSSVDGNNDNETISSHHQLLQDYALSPPDVLIESSSPQSMVGIPIYKGFQQDDYDSEGMVSMLLTSISWDVFFTKVLNDDVKPIDLIIEDTCGVENGSGGGGGGSSAATAFEYTIEGSKCIYKGMTNKQIVTDHPQAKYGVSQELMITTTNATTSSVILTNGCGIKFHFFPSTEFVEESSSNNSWIYTVVIILVFGLMFMFFMIYERCINKATSKNNKAVFQLNSQLNKSRRGGDTASLFNGGVDPDYDDDGMGATKASTTLGASRHGGPGGGAVAAGAAAIATIMGSMPIADLHPNVTVLFADIANFTAWSSVREPSQVFLLLETLFNTYDRIAKKYKVFKIETIGDCYVSVTGLPEACPDHAILMVRFAHDALSQMRSIVKQLEVVLGPDTAELAMRVGLHSGPVTAGVLRGEKSRFQLFGATVNTASTIENTGMKNRIHASSDTAEQIRLNGFEHWLVKRATKVAVKGRGEIETYWVNTNNPVAEGGPTALSLSVKDLSPGKDQSNHSSDTLSNPDEKMDRLINWSTDLLLVLLKRIIAMRESEEDLKEKREFEAMVQELDEETEIASRINNIDGLSVKGAAASRKSREPKIANVPGQTVLDEVKEIITLPRKVHKYQQDPNLVPITPNVIDQLTAFVSDVAHMYRDNPFHNFEHASHVTQSLTKLLSRVVTENEIDYETLRYKKKAGNSKLHKFSFGITSDPITQFAVAFSAIIHDLDHPGVPNAVLVKEETRIAKMYKDKSVAEQNSVDLAWGLLMEPRFKDLRGCIYKTQNELDRFRQLVVNSVMATDIVDKELGALRKKRWETAFNKDGDESFDEEARDEVNRKATIVIEHLIQAADVAHTMQHWHVYLKWNERFFHECYQVYLSGRSETDPSEGWYKGEIGFFDFYIIPLAKKLENCGVFGVSSDECLQYATANRNEWERKGKDIVATYLSAYENGKRVK